MSDGCGARCPLPANGVLPSMTMASYYYRLFLIALFVGAAGVGGGNTPMVASLSGQTYELSLPNVLVGYEVRRDFRPRITASVEQVLPNGIVHLRLSLHAIRAQEMKVSTDPQFRGIPWQDYTQELQAWRVRPQREPLTLYVVFKRKKPVIDEGSEISAIAHYTLDLNDLSRVLEKMPFGYMDWSAFALYFEVTENTQPQIPTRFNQESSSLFTVSKQALMAENNLKLHALQSLETLRVSPYVTIGDLLYLESMSRLYLSQYLKHFKVLGAHYRLASSVTADKQLYRSQYALPEVVLHGKLSLLATPPTTSRTLSQGVSQESSPGTSSTLSLYRYLKPPTTGLDPAYGVSNRFSAERYEKLVMDLRGITYSPNLYARVVTEDGRLILSSDLYKGDEEMIAVGGPLQGKLGTGKVSMYMRYVRSLDAFELDDRTLFIRVQEIRQPLGDLVISDFYGDIILSNPVTREQFANGSSWILVD